ncbi:hypothetical protein FBQ96_13685 [Nitrospirales bacterium NOB]|nr:hypothetical protein [Nitrospirales bacterium NOB]
MANIIINGRRIDPNSIGSGVRGSDLITHARAGYGRRPIIESGGRVSQIDPNKRYGASELVDKRGRGAKLTSMPDRSKGYGATRSRESRQTITEQVYDVATHMFRQGVDFDEEGANWMVVPDYPLPFAWHGIARSTALLIDFPKDFPMRPPVGFYLPDELAMAHDGHFFSFAAHGASDAPIREGWKWYCVYIHAGAWRPARDWRHGDNLFTYFHLVREALGNRG